MNLTHPSEVKELLSRLGLRPRRTLGQNFLIDANILRILLRTAELHREEQVLEVGPGLGVLTEWLVRYAGRVVAVEKDPVLFGFLKTHFAEAPHLELIHADILDVDLETLLAGGISKVVANLPYSVGSRFLVDLFQTAHPPTRIVVTVQREVARRLAAKPRAEDYGLLSILAQTAFAVNIVKEISPTCFLPPPEVRSAIVELVRLPDDREPRSRNCAALLKLLQDAFARRRKQLAPFLKARAGLTDSGTGILLDRLGIAPRARPEDISPEQWVLLSNALAPESDSQARH
ncbi:MAG TPA: 16S rRNA (adenine(1518)-N(6)/adenine(1519)-N(6))-dimethyltransferase RsmA [Kiritimatiellia bacterium]|nr:16S rRNA (adenine(1518)-N(6)/adenine(1519)-N(6))-dimethyltransferase RsmA [Kiritimatiellia bacterium]HRZ12615.1 16S rRNA (adenine(1518)-N(6)/adenine(1519)-N(6))-dimethyltransferase RsmA [Kiritimatiellia bacterium]HSA17693.1 16S rRNA (adenine(1518)-N(6)/adenine(1519)-N(6))-dimethyltransferase RsmA [Kiritimatiellia bacterium]